MPPVQPSNELRCLTALQFPEAKGTCFVNLRQDPCQIGIQTTHKRCRSGRVRARAQDRSPRWPRCVHALRGTHCLARRSASARRQPPARSATEKTRRVYTTRALAVAELFHNSQQFPPKFSRETRETDSSHRVFSKKCENTCTPLTNDKAGAHSPSHATHTSHPHYTQCQL